MKRIKTLETRPLNQVPEFRPFVGEAQAWAKVDRYWTCMQLDFGLVGLHSAKLVWSMTDNQYKANMDERFREQCRSTA